MIEELLEKIPPEKRWALTAKILTGLSTMRDLKVVMPLLGKGEGITAPVMGYEKYLEINMKIYTESGKKRFPLIKEKFNLPMKNALEAAKLFEIASFLLQGPNYMQETIEATPERAVVRTTKCVMWESYEGTEIDPTLPVTKCASFTQVWGEEGLKTINPKLIFKLTKSFGWGDPYCESVIEFKEE